MKRRQIFLSLCALGAIGAKDNTAHAASQPASLKEISANRSASGSTTPGATAWQQYKPPGQTGIYVDVDTSAGGFSTPPIYITSIGGDTNHWATTGATSIYLATATGFRVYVRYADGSSLTPAVANSYQWYINWIGMETGQ
jgi:hypothetical protein